MKSTNLRNHPLSCLCLVILLGSLLGWHITNQYAPQQIRSKARVFSVAKACTDECMVQVVINQHELRAIVVSDEEFYALAGRGKEGVYLIEDVEWFTGKHIRWHIEAIIVNSNTNMVEW